VTLVHVRGEGVLGERLKQLRAERKLSQTALAEAAGIDQRYYSELERSVKTNPSREVIQSLARVLEVPASDLAGAAWEGEQPPVAELQADGVPDAAIAEIQSAWPILNAEDRETALTVIRSLAQRRQTKDQMGTQNQQPQPRPASG
jgi:transcriptional regulator with XRE-family HTH domain